MKLVLIIKGDSENAFLLQQLKEQIFRYFKNVMRQHHLDCEVYRE